MDYMPFGEMMREHNVGGTSYQYTGQEYDKESGIHNYRARLYDSDLGRFYGMDPQEQFASPFSYAANNPIMNTDPDGEFVVAALIGAAISVITNGINNTINNQSFFTGAGKAALFGAIGGAASFGIGQAAGQLGSAVSAGGAGWSKAGVAAFQTVAHGSLGGIMNAANGESFGSGFLSGAFGSLAATGTGALMKGVKSKGLNALGIVGSGTLAGGIGSEISGGHFWDGARNGAISAGLNHAIHGGVFGEDLAAAALTGRTRHLFGADAIQVGLTAEASFGGSFSGEESILRILRGRQAGLYSLSDRGGGFLTDIQISGGIEVSKFYYSGKVSGIRPNIFGGLRVEGNFNITVLPSVSAGVTASYASVDNGRNSLYSIGYTVSAGLSAFDALLLPVTFGGNYGASKIRPLK